MVINEQKGNAISRDFVKLHVAYRNLGDDSSAEKVIQEGAARFPDRIGVFNRYGKGNSQSYQTVGELARNYIPAEDGPFTVVSDTLNNGYGNLGLFIHTCYKNCNTTSGNELFKFVEKISSLNSELMFYTNYYEPLWSLKPGITTKLYGLSPIGNNRLVKFYRAELGSFDYKALFTMKRKIETINARLMSFPICPAHDDLISNNMIFDMEGEPSVSFIDWGNFMLYYSGSDFFYFINACLKNPGFYSHLDKMIASYAEKVESSFPGIEISTLLYSAAYRATFKNMNLSLKLHDFKMATNAIRTFELLEVLLEIKCQSTRKLFERL